MLLLLLLLLVLLLLLSLLLRLLHLTSHAQVLPEKKKSGSSFMTKGGKPVGYGDDGGRDESERARPLPVPEPETSRPPEEEMRRQLERMSMPPDKYA